MPTYYCTAKDSDVVINVDRAFVLSADQTSSVPVNITVAVGDTQIGHFVTDQGDPNSDSWEGGGTMTCELNVTNVTGSLLRGRCRIRRCNANGTIIENGVFTAFQSFLTTGVYTFTPTVPTWTTAEENCGNRLVIDFAINNSLGPGNGTIQITLGDTNSEVISTISKNSGNCRRIFIA